MADEDEYLSPIRVLARQRSVLFRMDLHVEGLYIVPSARHARQEVLQTL